MSIRKNDLVLLDKEALITQSKNSHWDVVGTNNTKKIFSKIIANGAKSVGTVIGTKKRESIVPSEGSPVTKVSVFTTADVVWPEGFVRECPVDILIKVTK
jgi:hypothetical protein